MEESYHRNWQQANADKVRAYTAKYLEKKNKSQCDTKTRNSAQNRQNKTTR
ncbi:MAG: hypothetical protein VKN72_14950 [Nostocales cyanobacterium 94392]|nr:hypothetical protein [Nostocales cyanobacterium 94392]